MRVVARILLRERTTLELARLFEEARINHVILKGPVFAHWLYDEPMQRGYGDSDVLVDPAQFDRAEELLAELGFERRWFIEFPGKKPKSETDWIRRSDDARVDLHLTIQGAGKDPHEVWSVLSPRRRRVTISGSTIWALDDVGNALHAVLHTAQHGKGVGRPQNDLTRVLAKLPDEAWEEIVRLARDLDALEWLSSGLRLHEQGRVVAERYDLPPPTSVEALMRSESAAPVAEPLLWFSELPTRRAQLLYLMRTLFPSPEAMRTVTPLARRGRYGLAASYPWRWWWIARRLPRAVRSWSAARRRSRRS